MLLALRHGWPQVVGDRCGDCLHEATGAGGRRPATSRHRRNAAKARTPPAAPRMRCAVAPPLSRAARPPHSLQVEAFQCGGFVSKYLQTDMFEGCTLLSNLFGFDEISDVRLRPYIKAAELRQGGGTQQRGRGRGRPTNASRGKKRGRSR